MKTLKITQEWLGHQGACRSSRLWFSQLFPEGVVPTKELVLKHVDSVDWAWAITLLLFDEHREAAWVEQDTAIVVRDKRIDAIHELYREAEIGGCASFEKLVAGIEEGYHAYHTDLALSFLRHFTAQGGRELLPDEPRPTSGGVELTDEVLDRLAEEAEEGLDIENLRPRDSRQGEETE